ncbi:MAG: hypothetical protein NWE98_02230 [Candidatus Bathyarchaeota archaeon]|nr:hypothetical protein [Candidatus Bathyarchaeota archaeon]
MSSESKQKVPCKVMFDRYGVVSVEGACVDEVKELFDYVLRFRRVSPIDEAVR